MSWERLGVPIIVDYYIEDMDRRCLTIPLTPHAQYRKHMMKMNALSTQPSSEYTAEGFFGVTGTP